MRIIGGKNKGKKIDLPTDENKTLKGFGKRVNIQFNFTFKKLNVNYLIQNFRFIFWYWFIWIRMLFKRC